MPWIELTKPCHVYNADRPAGFRCDFPYMAALALVASGKAFWVDGPRRKEETPERGAEVPLAAEKEQVDKAEVAFPPDIHIPEGVKTCDVGIPVVPSRAGFLDLSLKEQKDLIEFLGLSALCDRRKPESMADALDRWREEQ